MKEEIKELNEKFIKIKEQGWIKTKRKGTSGIGYTFEQLIGKEEDNFPIPDYNNIEIKTSRRTSWGKIHLFHATPDGDYLFPIKDILEVLGYPDKDLPQYKVFNYTINAKSFTKIGYNKKAKIIINRNKQKVYLNTKNKYNKDLNIQISWSFNMLKQRLNLKLKYLAIIKAEARRINNTEYFKYNEIIFYKLKDFETFINLIEAGIINITFMIGLYKKGKRIGETHDHGTAFTINEKQIELLYDRLL